MKRLISMLTMKKLDKLGFFDAVSGKMVGYYKDMYGVEWMSTIPYRPFKFRIKASSNPTKTNKPSKIDINDIANV